MPVQIHGRDYITVSERIQKLREDYGITYSLTAELIHNQDGVVIVQATLKIAESTFTGMAEEDRRKGSINKTSALENCETSAVGRALAAAGYGGTEYASANEVEQAVHQQRKTSTAPQAINEELKKENHAKLVDRVLKGEDYLDRNPNHNTNSRQKHLGTQSLEDSLTERLELYYNHLLDEARKTKEEKSEGATSIGDVLKEYDAEIIDEN